MKDEYLVGPGDAVGAADLQLTRARDLAEYLLAGPRFAVLVECRRLSNGGAEVVVFDVDVEVSQRRVHDIHPQERIGVVCDAADSSVEVLALRQTFPLVPHLNVREFQVPRSLCLWDESFAAVKLWWTAPRLVTRIREWLALTAHGTLHAEDQALEPFFLAQGGTLVLPPDVFGDAADPAFLFVGRVGESGEPPVYRSLSGTRTPGPEANIVLTVFAGDPRPHGIIQRTPMTLAEVHTAAQAAGLDLLAALRAKLRGWESNKRLHEALLAILLHFPKTRHEGGPLEAPDLWAFLTVVPVREVGVGIGAWTLHQGTVGLLLNPDVAKNGTEVGVELLMPCFGFSRALAARCNGTPESKLKIAAVGVGALGSQVVTNLVRSGFGAWSLIDNDKLLPHNLARHALWGRFVGWPKARALAEVLNDLVEDEPVATPVVADVRANGAEVTGALAEAGVILDMAAAFEVGRFLVRECTARARRVSVFLNPTGTDLVVLAEDAERLMPLDSLEMQYYRAVIERGDLRAHFARPAGQTRYSRSCRDVTSTLPQDAMALHAATASRVLREVLASPSAVIAMFQLDVATGTVSPIRVIPQPLELVEVAGWTIVADEGVTALVARLREDRLPCETGGVLLGAFDVGRRIVYVTSALPAPPDSTERPVYFTRGAAGLMEQVAVLRGRTGNMLDYVGEWHAHPNGCSCHASGDDEQVLRWQAKGMSAEGLPALMLIVGDDEHAWYVSQLVEGAPCADDRT